eukprot:313063_1
MISLNNIPLNMTTARDFASAVLFIVLTAMLFIGTLMLSIIKQFFCISKKHHTSTYRLLQWTALCGLIGFFVAYLWNSIILISLISTKGSTFTSKGFQLFHFCFFNFCYTLSWSSFYTFMLLRIKYTFMDSVYAMSNTILYIHLIIAIFAPTVILIAIFSLKAFVICSIIFISITVIGSIHLIYKFNYNLWLLILSQNDSDNTAKDQLNSAQTSMIKTVVKHSILGAMILISLSLCAFTVTFGPLIEMFALRVFTVYIGALFIMNCGLALYLGFTVNNGVYLKLCSTCDKYVTEYYTARAEQKKNDINIKNDTEEQVITTHLESERAQNTAEENYVE